MLGQICLKDGRINEYSTGIPVLSDNTIHRLTKTGFQINILQ